MCYFKQKTAYDMRIRYWSSDGFSSDLTVRQRDLERRQRGPQLPYGNPALVQWLRSADIAELLGLIRQTLQAIACYHPKAVKDRHGPVQRYRLPAGHWSPVPRIRINSGNAPPM